MSNQIFNSDFQVVDELAIVHVLHQYCRACDRHDAALLRSVFHDDAVIHHPPLNAPADEFCRNRIEFVHGLGPSLHYISNILIGSKTRSPIQRRISPHGIICRRPWRPTAFLVRISQASPRTCI